MKDSLLSILIMTVELSRKRTFASSPQSEPLFTTLPSRDTFMMQSLHADMQAISNANGELENTKENVSTSFSGHSNLSYLQKNQL